VTSSSPDRQINWLVTAIKRLDEDIEGVEERIADSMVKIVMDQVRMAIETAMCWGR